ncbi:MAG: hypothetical protein AAGK04_03345, partial [Planctomycetota bacterium]
MPGLDGKALIAALKVAKKKPRNFLFAAGSKLEDHYLDLSKKRIPKSKAKEAKAAAGSPKAYQGVVEFDSDTGQLIFKTKLGFADKQTKALRMLVKKRAGLKSVEPVLQLVEELDEVDFEDDDEANSDASDPAGGPPLEEEEEMLPGSSGPPLEEEEMLPGAGAIPADLATIPEGEYRPESLDDEREAIQKADYTVTQTTALFEPEKMTDIVRLEVPVQDKKALNTAMERLADDPKPEEVDALLIEIVKQRPGKDLAAMRKEYEQFRRIREQAIMKAQASGD